MNRLWFIRCCVVCVIFSYFFCENAHEHPGVKAWLFVCLVIFLVTVVHPHFVWGVCSLFKGAWWMPWHTGPMKDV